MSRVTNGARTQIQVSLAHLYLLCISNPRAFLFLLRYEVICQSSELAKDILAPSYDPKNKHCVFQGDLLLFSCAGAHPRHRRICPCRDFIKGQVALCEDCL